MHGQRVSPGNQCLRCDDGRGGRQQHQRVERPGRTELIERIERAVGSQLGLGHQKPALAQIIQKEGREHHGEPSQSDRSDAKMPHVGIKGFAPGNGQHHRAQHHDTDPTLSGQEAESMKRVEGTEDLRLQEDSTDSQESDCDEPQQRDGAEDPAHLGRACSLRREENHDDPSRHRQDEPFKSGSCDFHSFDCSQDRDGRRDDPVTVEETRSSDADGRERLGQTAPVPGLGFGEGKCQQREDPALALVVGPQNVDQVLDGHDQDQSPDDQGEHPEHIGGTHWCAVTGCEAFFEGIDRARADVSIDDAQRGQRKAGQAFAGSRCVMAHSSGFRWEGSGRELDKRTRSGTTRGALGVRRDDFMMFATDQRPRVTVVASPTPPNCARPDTLPNACEVSCRARAWKCPGWIALPLAPCRNHGLISTLGPPRLFDWTPSRLRLLGSSYARTRPRVNTGDGRVTEPA